MNKEVFVTRLKISREKNGMTIKDFAEKCHVSVSAMNRYVSLASVPTLEVASTMAEVLGVSLDWLCGTMVEEQTDEKMTTGKLVRMLSTLLTTPTVIDGQEKSYAAMFREYNNGNVYISIDEDRIPKILDFASWQKFMELYLDGTIDKDMYTAWIDKKAKQLEGVPLPLETGFTIVDTSDLPF